MKKQVLFNSKIEVAYSEMSDGNMRYFDGENEIDIIKNQQKLAQELGIIGDDVARIRTIYGDRTNFTEYYEITKQNVSKYSINNSEAQILVSDGIITKDSNIGILLPLADCLGIVVFDEEHSVLGLLHAGRQNLEQLGPQKFVEFLKENYESNPAILKIYFSPYALNYRVFKFNKTLSEVAKEQIMTAGVLCENIMDNRVDTVDNDNLPSYSSGDKTKRFAIMARII